MYKSLVINPPFLEPHRPPISCAILAEILKQHGHEVIVKDVNIDIYRRLGSQKFHELQIKHTTDRDTHSIAQLSLLVEKEIQELDISSYDWILVSCFSYWNIEPTKEICKWIRKHSSAKIVIGGPGIEYQDFGKNLLNLGLVDYYIYGEAEHSLPALLQGQTEVPGINGLPPQQIDDIEDLPLPNYGYFDLKRYDWLLDDPDVFIYGSRGCVRKCTFCDVGKYWPKYRWRSGQSIANEMISNYEHHGIKNFFFADSLVNGNLKEFRTMCEILAKYKEGLFRWGSYAIVRPKSAHPASLFDLIEASGGKFWSLGIETGVDRIRFEMQKKFTNEDIDWHLEQSQRIGLQNNFLCISTWPSETLEEHQEYLQMFPRWQSYAVDGTIYGIRLSTTLSILDNTPLATQVGTAFEFEQFTHDVAPDVYMSAWHVPGNPELTHKEKFRRTVALYEAAMDYNWPLTNCLQNINELKSAISSMHKSQQFLVPRRSFPIYNLKD